jgi:hypothetical protein
MNSFTGQTKNELKAARFNLKEHGHVTILNKKFYSLSVDNSAIHELSAY